MRSLHIVALGLTALTLCACAKGQNSSNAQSTAATEATAPPSVEAMATSAAQAGNPHSNGAQVFQQNCASCHQSDGKGVPGSFPPLAGNPVVTGDPKHVIHIVKYGLNGKVEVHGHAFNGVMPAWTQLSNAQIADVVTHIRSSWGNSATAVTEAEVAAVSK